MNPKSPTHAPISPLYGFWAIAQKETLHIRRDPITLIFALVIPIVQLILLGYAVDFDVRHVRTAFVDFDRSRESRDYLASLKNTQYLDFVSELPTSEAAEAAVRRNDVRVAVIIPPDFARRLGTKNRPQARVLLDGSDAQVARPAQSAVARPSATPDVDARVTVLYNSNLRSQTYMVPGLIGIILQLVTVALTSFALVREREQGTLEQLMVSPLSRLGLMLGKIAPYSVLALIELVAVVFLGWLVFNVPVAGNFFLLFFLSIPFILAALAMGLLISTVAQTQGQAMLGTILTLLPSILLSGYIAPRETLPGVLYLLSDVFPVTYFIQIARGIIVRGAGFFDLLPNLLALLIIAAVLLTLATIRFRKSVA